MKGRVKVKVEGLECEGWGRQEQGFELSNEDPVFLHVISQCRLAMRTLSIDRIPLPRAWLAIPNSEVFLSCKRGFVRQLSPQLDISFD